MAGEVQPHPLPDLCPVPPLVVGQVKHEVVVRAYWVAAQQPPPPVEIADQVFGLLHPHSVVLTAAPLEFVIVLHGVHTPDIVMDFVVSQTQTPPLLVWPLGQVRVTQLKLGPYH